MLQEIVTLVTQRSGWLLGLLLDHLRISLIASFLACILGLALGIWISEHRGASRWTLGVVNFIYTIPSISLLGLLIPFSGIGNTTAIIALTIYALLPMVRNTYTGLTNLPPAMLEAATGMGSTRAQLLFKIKFPLALPVIIAGMRNMVTMTIALTGIASFIGAGGLGVAIYRGITTNNAALTIAGSLLTALLALVMDFILGIAERMTMKRRAGSSRRKKLWIGAAALVVACALIATILPMLGSHTIHIATKPMTEQYIMGEMLKEYIPKETGLKVELTQGVGGGTANIQPGMLKGDFDLYPEYTGTGWNTVLKNKGVYSEDLFPDLQKQYEEKFHMTWLGMYGFNNTFSLAVRADLAKQYGLETFSDLAEVAPKLTFGAQSDFYEREDGFHAVCKAYGFHFGKTIDLQNGLKYDAIKNGRIDVMNVFTTDGQLTSPSIKVLKDDKHFFPSYLCGNVVRMDTLAKYPKLKDALEKLTGSISDSEMSRMNDLVETQGKEPSEVAHQFLIEKGLIKEGGAS